MRVKWKQLLLKILVWLAVEILLTFLGLDDLADYSEFIFDLNEGVCVFYSEAEHFSPPWGAEERGLNKLSPDFDLTIQLKYQTYFQEEARL